MSFKDLGLSSEVLDALTDSGYSTPTPIQEKAIPCVLMGRDVLGCAQTGTGKTAGFVLPMIDILAEGRAKARMPRSLILAPTRELAHQVGESFERYGKYHKLSKALLIGGSSMSEQEKKLDRGVDVLIATPGRLLDLFERGKILLADVKILVIDEADRMLDMGFIPDVERIVGVLPTIRQTLFFSATMPKEIRRLADQFLMNPKEISVAPPASPAETVEQGLIRVPGPDKRKALSQLLEQEDVDTALIFCNRKRDVTALNKALQKQGINADELHGDMAQSMRMETLDRFKNGDVQILVCSDVAARGLDMPKVSHVFNYDVPGHPEDYVHRIGRTGRAGRSGKAFMLATPADAKQLALIEKTIGKQIPGVELDNVRILPAEEVEGPIEAADGAQAPEKAADEGKTKRRRGGRSKSRGKSAEAQPPKESANQNEGAEADVEANEVEAKPESEPAAETPEPANANADAAPNADADANADAAPEANAEAQPQQAADSKADGGNKGRRSRRGGKKAKDDAQSDDQKERSQGKLAEAAKASTQRGEGGKGKGRGKRAETAGNDQTAGKPPAKAARNRHGETQEQAANGITSKPFGDHTPAFLLKPLPESATA